MKLTMLSQTYHDDTIAEAMYAREMEWFHYDFDRANFEYLLKQSLPAEYKKNVMERLASTKEQMANVDAIYSALASQIKSKVAHAAAVKRTTAKRAAAAKQAKK